MTLEGEAQEYYERIRANVDLLVSGWRERVDYVVPVTYHRNTCHRKRYGDECECPKANEKRTRYLARPGLLEQLKEFQQNKDVNRDPKSERNPPRVKKPKMMPELNGFLALDEIVCDVFMTSDRIMEETGRDRTLASQPVDQVLTSMLYQTLHFGESRPDQARVLALATDKWVASAKRALNVSVSDAQFGDTVCGNCGGGLKIAWDNSSDVRCVGTPAEPPCGETYPMSEWVSLYEKGRRR